MTTTTGVTGDGEHVRANRYDVLSRLADDLAHEIKNPLNSIVINLEVLRRMAATGAQDRVLDRTAVIEQEVLRVHELIDEILQLLRPDKLGAESPAVDGVIGSLQNALQIKAKGMRVGFRVDVESSLYADIQAEPFKFALLNLMTCAIDAEAEAGGAVLLEARRAANRIDVVVSCSHAVLDPADASIEYCRLLVDIAGGRLEPLEPGNAGHGSMTTLALPLATFEHDTTSQITGHDFE
jgi:signal transduction histidine kinase